MAVEAGKSGTRQIVQVTWGKDTINGEVVVLHCLNPENGDVSVSGPSVNDGVGFVTYPEGYQGQTVITVKDNDGNEDTGTIEVNPNGAETVPPDETDPDAHPEHPIVIPDPPDHIWGPTDPRPTPPIVIINPGDDDFWTGNLPPSEIGVPHPNPNE